MSADPDHTEQLAWQEIAAGRLDALVEAAGRCDATAPADVMRLRKKWNAAQVHAALELVEARRRGHAKFGDRVAQMLSHRVGMEQATSLPVARYKAQRIADTLGHGTQVIDVCCGIGGDLMSLREAGLQARGLDHSPLLTLMAGHNTGCPVITDTLDADWPLPKDCDAIHIDPDRRPGGGRTLDPHAFSPPLPVVAALASRCPALAVKFAPGTDAEDLPFPAEMEYISTGHGVSSTLVQAVAWCGSLQRSAPGTTTATRVEPTGGVSSFTGTPIEQTADGCAAFVYTADPSVERADLLGTLAGELGAGTVWPGVGLITSDRPLTHPLLRGYRLLAEHPWREEKVRDALHALDAGVVTVKTRDKVVDPDHVAPRLRGAGSRDLVVFVLRFGEPVKALITEPM